MGVSASIEVNRILSPITALGPGRRLGLWVQGCSLRCPGCASRDTWVRGAGTSMETETLARDLAARVEAESLTGLTITGGEPLDQAAGVAALVAELRRLLHPRGLDLLIFTGYAMPAAKTRSGPLWALMDAVVAGPYRRDLPSDQPLVASSNQRLLVLTPGWEPGPGGKMQVMVAGGELTMVGLPRPGDLDRLEAELRGRGVHLGGASWRS
jgi:anaerobic ribonucleoside-triphosphate reductase activating protein